MPVECLKCGKGNPSIGLLRQRKLLHMELNRSAKRDVKDFDGNHYW